MNSGDAGGAINADKVQSFATICLTGNSAIDILRDAGIHIGKKLTAKAIQQIPGAVIIRLNQAVGFRLLTKAGTTGIVNLSRLIPIVGGLISGAIDVVTTRGIASAAKSIFTAIPSDKQAIDPRDATSQPAARLRG